MENEASTQSRGYRHLIIGGTIKSATSSLFNYISAHPQVCGSRVKETFFFTHHYTGDRSKDLKHYESYFSPHQGTGVAVEASPNYLAYKENVAPRIKELLPDAKLLFALRNPVDRLYSHFNFAKGKLEIPGDMTFEQYITLCEMFNADRISPAESGIPEKHLRAMEIGNYGPYLQNYYEEFDAGNIKVVFFDDLVKDPVETLADISVFIGVDPEFYRTFQPEKANVTFSAKIKFLHYLVLSANRVFESLFRRHPKIKQRLVRIYKSFNQSREGYDPMLEETRKKLIRYYASSNRKVHDILKGCPLPLWLGME